MTDRSNLELAFGALGEMLSEDMGIHALPKRGPTVTDLQHMMGSGRSDSNSDDLVRRLWRALAPEQMSYRSPYYFGLYNSAARPYDKLWAAFEVALNAQVAARSEAPL